MNQSKNHNGAEENNASRTVDIRLFRQTSALISA